MKAIKNTIYTLCFCIAIISAFWALGYDNLIIHPKLSRAGIEIYGKISGTKLTQEQASWIVEGSIAEDTDPRYINHFYNPETGKGLYFQKEILKIDVPIAGTSAKEWAQKQDSSTGDYSEPAILENYRQGDYERAYQGIGHILHLIQDMSVPAHTRDDDHADGDPYEEWAKQNGDVNPKNASFIKIDNLNHVFDELAKYSHYNFFSKDTIVNINKYKKITETVNGKNIGYLISNVDGINFKLAYSENPDTVRPTYKIDNSNIHLDYWNLLYPKAVGYSAGVIDYFIEQFKQIDQQKQEKEKLSLWGKTKSFFSELGSDTKYVWGDVFISARINSSILWDKTKSAATTTVEATKTAAKKATAAIKNVFSDDRVGPMANIANIGQVAMQSEESRITNKELRIESEINKQSEIASSLVELETRNDDEGIIPTAPSVIPTTPSVIPAEAGIQATKNLDSRIRGNDKKEDGNDTRPVIAIRQSAEKQSEPIHAPYQWPVESAQGSPSPTAGGSGTSVSSVTSGNITNQFQGQFNAANSAQTESRSTNQESGDSSPAAQNDTEEVAQNDAAKEEAAPQEESQDFSSVIPAEAGIKTQEEPQPESQNVDSSPEAQNDTEPEPEPQSEQQPIEDVIASETTQSQSPQINFYLTSYNVRSQNFTLNWQDTNNIIQSWELEYRLGPNFDWADLANSSSLIAGSYPFTAQYDDLTYYFRLQGQDASGNLTEWQNLQADISINPVVINEIAWMGTQTSTDDEWIELANKTDQEIDLVGWTLRESDGAPEIILTGKISPNGFYLLERTDDTTVANITADQIYTGALNNPQSSNDYGKDLILSDVDGNIVDQTKTAYNGVSNSNSKMSSERVSIWADSNNRDNWQYYWTSYLAIPTDAKDAGGYAISGTPKSKNSWADKFFSISTDIAKNTTLLKDRGTVKVLNNINISGEAILNIEPGTVLKFGGSQSGFDASSGGILAKGTADNKIVFTSADDNNYGINISQKSPLAGDWGKINFGENTAGEFDNIILKYSGAGTATPSIQGYKANLKISNSTFNQNKYDVLSVEYSNIDIVSNTFESNNRNGITISEGTSNITNNTFNWLANPGVGIYIKSQKGTINISNNQFTSVYSPILMDYLGNFTILGNQASGNSYNGILINSPSGYSYDEEIYLDSNMVYIVPNFIYYTGPKLKFAPGTIMKFAGALYIQGDFEAIGTADKPITFTRIGDDSVGGDSEGNGMSVPSYWRAFHISGATNVVMDYFTIKHGGNGWNYINEDIDGKCLKVFNGVQNFTFTNSTMSWCGRGLYSYTDNAQIENSIFSYNSFNLESYAQTGHISNATFGDTLVEMISLSDYQKVNY